MQNYLQSRKGNIKRKIGFALLSGAAVIFLALALFLGNYSVSHKEKRPTLRTVSVQTGQKETQAVPMADEPDKEDTKMNNESPEVAKNGEYENTFANHVKLSDTNIAVLLDGGRVENMSLEEYVLGCVLGEMPLSFEPQALIAQSIAVRSFTVNRILGGNSKHKNADVCADFNCCQSYIPPDKKQLSEESRKKLEQAVNAARGVIMLYDGMPIEAVYHASGGFCTLDSEDVWGGRVEYLRGVKAPEGEAELSEKTYYFTYAELSRLLSEYTGQSVSCGAFGSKMETQSDGVLTSAVSADGVVLGKSDTRKALGLASTDFCITGDSGGVTVKSYGNGHRVGMSQHGANLLAKSGMGYTEILKYYYSGIYFGFVD